MSQPSRAGELVMPHDPEAIGPGEAKGREVSRADPRGGSPVIGCAREPLDPLPHPSNVAMEAPARRTNSRRDARMRTLEEWGCVASLSVTPGELRYSSHDTIRRQIRQD